MPPCGTGEELARRLEAEFNAFSGGKKAFSVSFDKGKNISIYNEDELRRMKELEARKEKLAKSDAVQAALDMGFEMKGVFANEK